MKRFTIATFSVAFMTILLAPLAEAQRPRTRPQSPNRAQQQNNQRRNSGGNKKEEPPPLPSDKRLLALHQRFVQDAEKLAGEYERNRDWDKAKDVYKEIVKLVPQYENAQRKLQEIRQRESVAEKERFTVQANKSWQDTGVIVEEGKPVAIRAIGKWTFTLKREVSPDGMTIPKELRDFNLGSLLGMIQTANKEELEPFAVGAETSFIAKKTGKLWLKMHDSNYKDNDGFLKVEIVGTFRKR